MSITAKDVVQEVSKAPTMVAVFKNNLLNCRYTLKNGKDLIFMNGETTTNNEAEIKELMEEIGNGHPHLYIDAENAIRDTKYVDPVEAIRAQVIADLKAQGLLIAGADTDMGNSEQNLTLNVGTTRSVAEAMMGSTSVDAPAAVNTAAQAAKVTITPGKV